MNISSNLNFSNPFLGGNLSPSPGANLGDSSPYQVGGVNPVTADLLSSNAGLNQLAASMGLAGMNGMGMNGMGMSGIGMTGGMNGVDPSMQAIGLGGSMSQLYDTIMQNLNNLGAMFGLGAGGQGQGSSSMAFNAPGAGAGMADPTGMGGMGLGGGMGMGGGVSDMLAQAGLGGPQIPGVTSEVSRTLGTISSLWDGIDIGGTMDFANNAVAIQEARLASEEASGEDDDESSEAGGGCNGNCGESGGSQGSGGSTGSSGSGDSAPSGGSSAQGSGSGGSGGGSVEEGNAEDVIRFFQTQDRGDGQNWTREQAAGIAANLEAESGIRSTPVGDGGLAYGVAQWHPDRQANYEDYARANNLDHTDIRDASLEDQLGFINYELTQGTEQGAGQRLRDAGDARSAAAAFTIYYERPSNAQQKAVERGENAASLV
ncbi:MAG: phage tail tip lysozyme [Vampirovibrionales bacterium]|nr:phage tail tip lysozyme [Vampirovibrionales bacterium]